jgi:hypothetical protein
VYFAFVDPSGLARLLCTYSERRFRETNMVALAAAAERCRCREVDSALRKEAEAGQEDAMYALAHGRAASFVDDLVRWAGTPGNGVLRPTALGLLAESRSEPGVCLLVQVILDVAGTAALAAKVLRDHGLIFAELAEQLSRDAGARIGGRADALGFPVGELSALGLVQLLVEHGGSQAAPLLARFESHPSPNVVDAARLALRRSRASRAPYR